MGVLGDESGRRVTLGQRTLVGRAETCALRPASARVSAEHACIFWHGGRWCLRDLGSRNGTWLDGRRLEPGERAELVRGARIALGGYLGAPLFTLLDAGPPGVRATCSRTGAVISGADLVQLGDGEGGWTVYHDGARWVAERDGTASEIADQATLEHGGCVALDPPVEDGALDGPKEAAEHVHFGAIQIDEVP